MTAATASKVLIPPPSQPGSQRQVGAFWRSKQNNLCIQIEDIEGVGVALEPSRVA